MRFPLVRAALAVTTLAFITATAQASMLAALTSVAPATGGFRFSYNVTFDGADFGSQTTTLEAGDFFSIYDFLGFVPGSNLQPVANWTFSTALIGKTPAGTTTLVDDPTIPNLSWTYTGPSLIQDGSVGTFSAVSTLYGITSDFFAAQNTQTFVGTGSFPQSNVAPVQVPAVPEPGTIALLALGLLPLLGGVRRRRSAS